MKKEGSRRHRGYTSDESSDDSRDYYSPAPKKHRKRKELSEDSDDFELLAPIPNSPSPSKQRR